MTHAPEYTAILAQQALLQAIDGTGEWRTTIGQSVLLMPIDEVNPTDHIALRSWRSEPRSINDAMLYIDWEAVIAIENDSDLREALVLADMRAALTCGSNKIQLADVQVTRRESGSQYAVVGVTTAVHTPTR
jgi:hypothetical protein